MDSLIAMKLAKTLERRLSLSQQRHRCDRPFASGFCAVLMAGLAWAVAGDPASAATLTLGSAPGFPGQIATVSMQLNAGTNLPPHVTAVQADVVFDSARISALAPATGSALRGHRVVSREPTNGLRRVVLYSPNNAAMTNGTVVRLPFAVAPTNYQNVRLELTNVVLAVAAGNRIATTNFSGVIFLNPVFFGPEGVAEGFLRTSSDQRHLIQATTDFLHWTTIATNEAIGSIIRFMDLDAAQFPRRFYRAVLSDAAGQFGTIAQLPGGQVQFSFSGMAGRSYVIEATTNLTDWRPVATNMAVGGQQFLTNSVSDFPYRFFRLVLPQ